MEKTKIVILGSGFAGMFTAKYLRKYAPKNIEIDLVNETNYFIFQPLLPEVAAGNITASDAVSPLRQLLSGVHIRQAKVRGMNFSKKTVSVIDNTQHIPVDLSYDHLVLALGQTVNLTRFPGVQEHAMTMKTLADAYRLRNHVINTLELADVTNVPTLKRKLLTYVIVGAGFSGVETVGELKDMIDRTLKYYPNIKPEEIKIILVEYADRILQELPEKLSTYAARKLEKRGIEIWLNTATKSASARIIEMEDGRIIETATFVATIGTAPSPLVNDLGLKMQWGRIVVDGAMKVSGKENLWAVGDAALIPLGDKPPVEGEEQTYAAPTAQFAQREAKTLARNIIADINGKPMKNFDFKPMGSFASIGQHKAVAVIFGIKLSGTITWLLWRTLYLGMLPGLAAKVRVMLNWLLDHFFSRSTVQVQQVERPAVRNVRFSKGDVVFRPGMLADGFYTVLSGSFKLDIDDPDGGEPYQRVLEPGDHFGERVIFGEDLRVGHVTAQEDSYCMVIEREDFLHFATCFKFLEDYFKNYINGYFPENLRPKSMSCQADKPK
ncbi:MAG: FAD-dependent oxidoreductase [Rhodospirillaceae bacterium]|nr:FAD-dependent oxidoreductase [Rhodospirillaceae bacterium]MBT5374296.1 FAD-dependent oxidoreductase [Rhodospirillaceae bacterium]MBT5659214.1 FAD-dependent oxidoreductase [Rhodospirillaceae bacterium]MBT5752982.1 FAD-dependent oxidoreductase [Rhodospirillaceae bacterium]